MSAFLTTFFMIFGVVFMLVASLGLLRMPDVYLRISACAKATTLGVASTLLATAIHFDSVGVTSRAIATTLFILLTSPVAAHMIGRAAYLARIPMWKGTIVDELRGHYDQQRPGSSPADAQPVRETGPTGTRAEQP